jgi:DUF3102 family protein
MSTMTDPATDSVLAEVATLASIADEANERHRAIQGYGKKMVYQACALGRVLRKAKKIVGHRKWGAWLEEYCDFSQSTAIIYMRINKRWSELKPLISQSSAKMSIDEAIKHLAGIDRERDAGDESAPVGDHSPAQQAVEPPAPVAPPTKPPSTPEDEDEPEPVRSSSKPPAPTDTAKDKLAVDRPPLTERKARAGGTPNIELGRTAVECYLELQKRIKAESVEIIVDGRDGCIRFNDGNSQYSSQVRIRTWEKQPAANPIKIQVDAKKLASVLFGVESWDEYDFFVDANGVGVGQFDAAEEWFIRAQAAS